MSWDFSNISYSSRPRCSACSDRTYPERNARTSRFRCFLSANLSRRHRVLLARSRKFHRSSRQRLHCDGGRREWHKQLRSPRCRMSIPCKAGNLQPIAEMRLCRLTRSQRRWPLRCPTEASSNAIRPTDRFHGVYLDWQRGGCHGAALRASLRGAVKRSLNRLPQSQRRWRLCRLTWSQRRWRVALSSPKGS